jgi:uncharacterized membrane protein YqjE
MGGVVDRMTEHTVDPVAGKQPARPETDEQSVGQLVTQLSEQSSKLVRSELELALAEMQEKAKNAGVGAGLFGAAGVVALYGVGALIATVVIALALVLPAWLAALTVTVVLFVIAGIAALVGKKRVSRATPATPQQTIGSVKRDIETVKESLSRDDTR